MIFRAVTENDLPQLKAIWLSCFEEEEQAVELFFKRNLSFTHGYAAEQNGALIAAVYLVDCTLCGEQAHYLCGAATLPDFRRQGVMSGLIRCALADAQSRGDRFSTLLPASDGLYRYYETLGYRTAGTVYRESLLTAPGEITPGKPDFQRLQQDCFQDKFLLWNNNYFDFAREYYACYGVQCVESKHAFALYEPNGDVFYAVYYSLNELKALLFQKGLRRVTLWRNSGGHPVRQGMILPLSDALTPDEFYIGLSLQ